MFTLDIPCDLAERLQRVLYFGLASAIESGLVRTMDDVLSVLRQASQPLGPMGAEWLERQDRALKRESP